MSLGNHPQASVCIRGELAARKTVEFLSRDHP